jgi:FKBP-type peptidyl-prolyl cis-trans isomerase FkpA
VKKGSSIALVSTCMLVGSMLLGLVSCKVGTPTAQTDRQKTIYALGFSLADRLAGFDIKPDEVGYLTAGIDDGFKKAKPQVPVETFQQKIQEMSMSKMKSESEGEKKDSDAFLAKAASEPGVEKLPSGILFKSIKEGTGATPSATDTVKVHYHGTLRDGTVFDSSVDRGQPATFPLNQVIPCWTEGVQKLKVGGKAKLVCPADKAYGDRGAPPKIKGGAALTFEVELLGIEAAGKGAPAVAGAPGGKKDAKAPAKKK